MRLRIYNDWTAPLSAAIMFYSPDTCGGEGDNFELRGWWNIAPRGGSAVVFGGDVDFNRYWFIYAFATDGRTWTGPWRHGLPTGPFSACWGIGNTQQTIDGQFFRFDVGDNENYNMHLT